VFARLTDARSGLTVSGDFYDFIPLTDDRVGIVIGDVSGKGMPAALLMTSVRASVRAWTDNGYCTSEIITRVNDSIWQDTSSNNFVTLFYCVLDTKAKTVTYCNAGHNPPIVLRKDKTEFEFLKVGGIPLGMFSSQKYTDDAIQLEKGDLVVLYTDGVTEAMNSSDEFFGDEKLQSIIKRRSSFRSSSYEVAYQDLSASKLLDEIRNQVDSFIGDASRFDDMTLVIIKAL
jgi:sigma-B regulation protein RsbU (phosphoserine phosphatase)